MHDDLLYMSNGYVEPLDNAMVVQSLGEVQGICSRIIDLRDESGKRPVWWMPGFETSVMNTNQPQPLWFLSLEMKEQDCFHMS